MEIVAGIIFISIPTFLFFYIQYISCKSKVREYIELKYHNQIIESIRWTLLGPFAPGKGNYKFKVVLKNKNKNIFLKKEVFAITSFFGDVFIRD